MARIPETEIERLKNDVAVERLVESAGIALKKSGKDLIGTCPFHDDGEPSLVITPAKNLWHCFGCGAGGDPIAWVMKWRGISFRHAVELLHTDPALAAQALTPVKRTTVRTLPAPVSFDADDQVLLNQTIGYYHETLKQSPEALAYLKTRSLDHPELITHFKLGYANRTLGLRLPEKNRIAGADIRTRLENIGIYRASGHEHFNGSLIVPIMDASGNVTEIYGRKITDGLRKGTPSHLYLPGPHRGVFNLAALQASKEIILCEALIDAMTFWCAGYRNVTASYGTEGFTDDHLAAFKQYGTERVLIAYDRDDAGERAADKLAEKLLACGIGCFRIRFPKGMDANDYALKVAPAAKSLGVLIRKAVWLGKGYVPPENAPQPVPLVAPTAVEAVSPLAAQEEPGITAAPAMAPLSAPLPASPLPPAPADTMEAMVAGNEIVLAFGERRYRVRGLSKNLAYDVLKVNVLASCGDAFHVDTLDLYNARARHSYIVQAAIELRVTEDTIKADLGRVLLKLEALQEAQIQAATAPSVPEAVTMDAAEREAALTLLRSPDLLQKIVADFDACGIVGETTNKLVGYLAATSRRLDHPLAIVIQSSSAAGKSSLMDAVLALMPEEERIKYSAMTGQSLFYMGETNLKHKILAIVEEEGASRASYALKLLQSEGELTIASTGTDPKTGNLVTQEYRVEGPVMMFLTTTAIDIDEELMNRCLVLTVDEDREQTRAIHRLQREKRTLQGLVKKEHKQQLLSLHRNAQRLLKKLAVVNPYAERLTFTDERTRTRRDHEKYLTLIDTIALLHQYQRDIKTTSAGGQPIDYIEVTLDDIAAANAIAHDVLGRSLDELPPQTRRVLAALHGWIESVTAEQKVRRSDVRFTRSDVRRVTSLSDTQCRLHIERLIALEYVLVHRGTRGQSFAYELLYDGQGTGGAPFVAGLIDVEALKTTSTTPSSRGQTGQFAEVLRPHRGGHAASVRTAESGATPSAAGVTDESPAAEQKTQPLRANGKTASSPKGTSSGAYPHLPLAAAPV
ncbi:MAG: DNA primase [Burkholderiales bacterium RIFCSPLOWO2_02_FULL_57_36]|nr:MAG: DNA primase [Burkholderiales bacterium RIFCSPLOWO2_02_FULL_57_36]